MPKISFSKDAVKIGSDKTLVVQDCTSQWWNHNWNLNNFSCAWRLIGWNIKVHLVHQNVSCLSSNFQNTCTFKMSIFQTTGQMKGKYLNQNLILRLLCTLLIQSIYTEIMANAFIDRSCLESSGSLLKTSSSLLLAKGLMPLQMCNQSCIILKVSAVSKHFC